MSLVSSSGGKMFRISPEDKNFPQISQFVLCDYIGVDGSQWFEQSIITMRTVRIFWNRYVHLDIVLSWVCNKVHKDVDVCSDSKCMQLLNRILMSSLLYFQKWC